MPDTPLPPPLDVLAMAATVNSTSGEERQLPGTAAAHPSQAFWPSEFLNFFSENIMIFSQTVFPEKTFRKVFAKNSGCDVITLQYLPFLTRVIYPKIIFPI